MCPYARFQSAMFDKDTLIVSYDPARGEPRGARKRGRTRPEDARRLHRLPAVRAGVPDRHRHPRTACNTSASAARIASTRATTSWRRSAMRPGSSGIRRTTRSKDEPTHVLRPRVIGYAIALSAMVHRVRDRAVHPRPGRHRRHSRSRRTLPRRPRRDPQRLHVEGHQQDAAAANARADGDRDGRRDRSHDSKARDGRRRAGEVLTRAGHAGGCAASRLDESPFDVRFEVCDARAPLRRREERLLRTRGTRK